VCNGNLCNWMQGKDAGTYLPVRQDKYKNKNCGKNFDLQAIKKGGNDTLRFVCHQSRDKGSLIFVKSQRIVLRSLKPYSRHA